MKLIVGLGNPGPEYQETRHNAGFMVVDALLARSREVKHEHRYGSNLFQFRYASGNLMAMQPLTFMNLSGQAVAKVSRVFDLSPSEIMVVYDCLDIPLGRLRMRHGGSSGGHRGMESVIHELGTSNIPRLRIGIGRADTGNTVDHVLSSWQEGERDMWERVLKQAVEAVLWAVRRGVGPAMNRYNSDISRQHTNSDDLSPHGESEAESNND